MGRAKEFDYIVVGAGSAGSALANRLTEDADVSVLLLEAGGPDNHPLQLMPIAFLKVAHHPRFNWGFVSEPEPGLGGRVLPIPRGKTLGGSSSVNASIAIRGNRRDYDIWRQMGNEGWSYLDVLPYFRRLERSWRGETPYHGGAGPVGITPVDYPDNLFEPLRAAALSAGVPISEDPNGAEQEGLSRMEATVEGGKRTSAARAYLHPVMHRTNLTIATHALTLRVLIEHGRAIGVDYARDGQMEQAWAAREVIVCGGSFNSPQLLMLSGIGPAEHLREMGIAPLHDLPGVGKNLGEHPNILNIYQARGREGLTKFLRFDRACLLAARWFMRHDGQFANNGAAANIFLRTRPELERPDVQMICMAVSNTADVWFPRLTTAPVYCFSVRVGALHPQSRGWVKLRSADPRDAPRILFNMFAVQEDLDTMVRGVRACREIYRQTPQLELISRELAPGVERQSDADIAAFIRANAGHRSHPVGTCRMGHDAMAVVDPQLRVHGIAGLRVVDASVMPELPGGNTNLPTIMIGEKAADMIRGRHLEPAVGV